MKTVPFRFTALAAALLSTGIVSAATNIVSSCSDDLALGGTLRNTIASSAPGDIVDVSHLDPTTCSVITLTTGSAPNGPIVVNQAANASGLGIKIQGPGAAKLAISAKGNSRVLTHTGAGELVIDGLTIEQGTVYGPYTATPQKGGCIASYGTLYLSNSNVSGCAVVSSGGNHALGGGIYGNSVVLHRSTISGNSAGPAPGATASGEGGGIAALSLHMYDTTVSNNNAYGPSTSTGLGGGIYAMGSDVAAFYSSVTNNRGYSAMIMKLNVGNAAFISHSSVSNNSGIAIDVVNNGAFFLLNSTVSDNGLFGILDAQAKTAVSNIYNSTIAFNGYGTYLVNGTSNLQSTIISNSRYLDLIIAQSAVIRGADNLIVSSDLSSFPAGLVSTSADPKLGPLQNNGGPTLTRMLSHGSPAIGAGNNMGGAMYDQRGPSNPRTTGASKTVDIGAVQFDTIFADGFEEGPP